MTALQKRQSDNAVRGGQEFFRLFQDLESGGDIYEINTSTKALCVGPQSDLANYTVNFFDSQAPDNIDEINLSINNPVIGRVDALLATKYPTASGLPARILISPRDLVDNEWLPADFVKPIFFPLPPTPGDFVAARPRSKIDILSYLKDPPALAPLRDDRLHQFPFVPANASPLRAFYILPYYGRRYGEFSLQNFTGGGEAQTYTINIQGVNLFPGTQSALGTNPGKVTSIITQIAAGVIVPPGSRSNLLIKADTDGMFDLISIDIATDNFVATTDSSMQLLTSDRIG